MVSTNQSLPCNDSRSPAPTRRTRGTAMRLPLEIKHLCAKIAHERIRPQQWQMAHELRKDAARVLASGTDIEGVQAWLEGLLHDALRAQTNG